MPSHPHYLRDIAKDTVPALLLALTLSAESSANPSRVADLNTTPMPQDRFICSGGSFSPVVGVTLNDKYIFCGTDGEHGKELWVTDGTLGGTSLLKHIDAGRWRLRTGGTMASRQPCAHPSRGSSRRTNPVGYQSDHRRC